MLVDPKFISPGPQTSLILGMITGGASIIPNRIRQGVYLSNHWNVSDLVIGSIQPSWQISLEELMAMDYEDCGVCDNFEQPIEAYNLATRPENFFISFVEILKSTQPKQGGWRWHKWGPYIGNKEPTSEYIADEPFIEKVYTFSIYQLETTSQ